MERGRTVQFLPCTVLPFFQACGCGRIPALMNETIEGTGNIPGQPSLFLLNRADLSVVSAVERALGGAGRVAWLVEQEHLPSSDIMQHLRQSGAAGIITAMGRESRESLFQRIHTMLGSNHHVVLLPPPAASARGALSDAAPELLTMLDGFTLPVLPLYASLLRERDSELMAVRAPYDRVVLRVLPALRPGAAMGLRVMTAWMEGAADTLEHHPALEQASLPLTLVRAMLARPNARLIDGTDDSSMSFCDVLALAVMFTRVLRTFTSQTRIGIILPPGKYATVAYLACWLCGLVPVPVDYTADAKHFRRVKASAGLTRFITEERFVQKQNTFSWPPQRDRVDIRRELLLMGKGRLKWTRLLLRLLPERRLLPWLHLPQPSAETEATLNFTAGTTGEPKAASITQRALLAEVLQLRNRLQLSPGESALCALPAYNPYGMVFSLLLPLLSGLDMVTYPMPEKGKRLCALIERYGVRLTALPQKAIRRMFEHAKEGLFHSLHYLFCVGGPLPSDLGVQAARDFRLHLLECYGLAEAAPLVALSLPDGDAPTGLRGTRLNKPHSSGAPLPGVAVRITDPYRDDVVQAPDSPGMVWLKGPSILHNYLNDEKATLGRVHGRWFCTGDIGHLDADGLLTIDGRKTRFSKIEGHLVPHEQLEQVLLKVLKVRPDASRRSIAVIGVPDRAMGEQLVMLSTLHRICHPNDLVTLRYGIMNEGYPTQWRPTLIAPVSLIPELPDGSIDYPTCYALACKAARVQQ